MLFTDFVSTSYCRKIRSNIVIVCCWSHFVNTADPKTEGPTLDSCAIHVVSNEENKLLEEILRYSNKSEVECLTLRSSLKCLASSRERPASESFLAP